MISKPKKRKPSVSAGYLNARQKFEAQEVREFVMARNHGMCEYSGCDMRGTQIAHCISKSKANIQKYGKEIVHHPKLLRWSCWKHNDSFNRGFRPEWIRQQIAAIMAAGIKEWI